ncbi:hypothetical protein [Fortiea contorta]|uniref:hypothetical protein n=1 Tax=Fortiea contorta TaxID=1892405 RepID=UPI0003479A1D|nr:hypothetical protein [Fortiea contorta]
MKNASNTNATSGEKKEAIARTNNCVAIAIASQQNYTPEATLTQQNSGLVSWLGLSQNTSDRFFSL